MDTYHTDLIPTYYACTSSLSHDDGGPVLVCSLESSDWQFIASKLENPTTQGRVCGKNTSAEDTGLVLCSTQCATRCLDQK